MNFQWSLRWKILVVILLAAIYFWAIGGACSQSPHHPTEGQLAGAYLVLNDQYFYGGLPVHKTKIILVNLPDGKMGQAHQNPDDTWVISIDIVSNPIEKQAELTMIHEACHQQDLMRGEDEGVDGHGEAFQACMLEKAGRGAFKGLW